MSTSNLRSACLLAATCLVMAASVSAQPFYGVQYRPRGIKYDVVRSEHFEIIYERGQESLAARVAAVAENARPEVIALTGLRRPLKLPIIINGFNDASNGFVSPLPFRMEIEAAPIKGKVLNPRYADWAEQVVPHELAHAAHAEIRGGFGVGDVVRLFAPDWARSLNFGMPSGLSEGFAVHYESTESGLGRLHHAFTMMQVRAALADRQWTLSQVLDPPEFTRPFDRYYSGGGAFVRFADDSLRADFFPNAVRFYNRWPFLGPGVALWQSIGIPPWEASSRFVRYGVGLTADPTPATVKPERVLTDETGLTCRRPKWLDEETIVAYCSGYNMERGFYTVGASSGHLRLVSAQSLTEDTFFSLDRERAEIYFADYRPLLTVPGAYRSRIRRISLSSGAVDDVVGTDRGYAPVELDNGSLLGLWNDGQYNRVVQIDGQGQKVVSPSQDIRVLEMAPGPSTELLLLANEGGRQALWLAPDIGKGVRFGPPLIEACGASIFDPAWHPRHPVIIFAADVAGKLDLYRFTPQTGTVNRLTDDAFGAFEPAVSPDGRRIAYVRYRHEQSQLVVAQYTDSPMETASGFVVRRGRVDAESCPATADNVSDLVPKVSIHEAAPYSAFPRFLRPRSIVPFIRFRESRVTPFDQRLGAGFGVSIGGTDPLRSWAYAVTGSIQEGRPWGSLLVQTGKSVLRPFLALSDRPTTAVVRGGRGLVQIPAEERSIEIGSIVPLTFPSDSRYTAVAIGASAELRSIRPLDRDANPLDAFDDRVTLNPLALISYRIRSNTRDIVPSAGISILTRAEIDLQTEALIPAERIWRTDARVYLPVFPRSATRIALLLGAMWKNQGSGLSQRTFLPRGFDESDEFIAGGTFFKVGTEVVHPVLFLDRGLILFPINIQAVYLYTFAETMGRSAEWRNVRSSIGAGVGFRSLLWHHLNLDLRIGVARLLERDDWAATGR